MAKSLFIAEKPSVAQEFAKALDMEMRSYNGYKEGETAVVTWCVGHLVTMSYPEAYDIKYKRWSLSALPFLPEQFQYEIIGSAANQYRIVEGLLHRKDVDTIYVCTDSGREGEYIYRLVEQMAGVQDKKRKRVWIDSQTKEEILRGIREAKDLSEYDNIAKSAYLRAKEDYLMGINFSRLLTLKYGDEVASCLHERYAVISVGRVMTCVLGMVVRREREIREFVKTPFYRVAASIGLGEKTMEAEWKVNPASRYYQSPKLYKENGFLKEETAKELIASLADLPMTVEKIEKKKETKNAPLLYNLAELQNDCSRFFKISPDETLAIVQELYEKKLVTYPRTDARALSVAVSKEISKNIRGLGAIPGMRLFVEEILESGVYRTIAKTRYVNDKQITDHYAIIPTGQGIGALSSLHTRAVNVYEVIVRRFLAIFYPAAVYRKIVLTAVVAEQEKFVAGFKALVDEGYQKVMRYSFQKKKNPEKEDDSCDRELLDRILALKKKDALLVKGYEIREGETSPPRRYNSGSMILAMENAGQFIEDEELRAQIKGSGIGTSATRAEILKKLVGNGYLALNAKTQVITPALRGEMIYDVVYASIRSLLNPELTASWEKGLTYVAEGSITEEEYMEKLTRFIRSRTEGVLHLQNRHLLRGKFEHAAGFYKKAADEKGKDERKQTSEKTGKEDNA